MKDSDETLKSVPLTAVPLNVTGTVTGVSEVKNRVAMRKTAVSPFTSGFLEKNDIAGLGHRFVAAGLATQGLCQGKGGGGAFTGEQNVCCCGGEGLCDRTAHIAAS